jgi:hypothetical protein
MVRATSQEEEHELALKYFNEGRAYESSLIKDKQPQDTQAGWKEELREMMDKDVGVIRMTIFIQEQCDLSHESGIRIGRQVEQGHHSHGDVMVVGKICPRCVDEGRRVEQERIAKAVEKLEPPIDEIPEYKYGFDFALDQTLAIINQKK